MRSTREAREVARSATSMTRSLSDHKIWKSLRNSDFSEGKIPVLPRIPKEFGIRAKREFTRATGISHKNREAIFRRCEAPPLQRSFSENPNFSEKNSHLSEKKIFAKFCEAKFGKSLIFRFSTKIVEGNLKKQVPNFLTEKICKKVKSEFSLKFC